MRYLVCACVAAALLAACQKQEAPPADEQATATPSTPPVTAPAPSARATAELAATQGNTASGSLTLAEAGEGVHLTGSLQGLAPNSEFGFHIHEKGDCSAPDASSAGGHFNPTGVEHGNPQEGPHHAGDMLNVNSDAEGQAQVDAQASGVTLGDGGASDIMGKAVVLHERADDYHTQPSGDSGTRIACGVITAG